MGSVDADISLHPVKSAEGDQLPLRIDGDGLKAGIIDAVDAPIEPKIHLLATAVADAGGAA
jgi:hypothetical protein